MQRSNKPTTPGEAVPGERVPEARYAYYRRCQLFRRNGEQCKAPAEKGEAICHAHAAQQAMALRRERERQAVLAEAVAEMRRQGKPDCEMADLFTDFKGIQVTLAVMAQALVDGRINCKTAGRMVVHLQTMSKLLWLYHRDHRGTQREKYLTTRSKNRFSCACAGRRPWTTKDTKGHEERPQIQTDWHRLDREKELPVLAAPQAATPCTIYVETPRAAFEAKVRAIPEKPRSLQNGTWEEARAA